MKSIFSSGLLAALAKATIPEDTENTAVEFQNFAAFDFGLDSQPNTCYAAIDRVKAGPYDYAKIVGSGKKFSDDYFFPANQDMLIWPENPRSGAASL